MTTVALILTVFMGLVSLVWTTRHLAISRARRTSFTLTEGFPVSTGEKPLISVIVAAKDEQENIETCVRTMLDQDYPNFELIVANDRSTDRTAEIVERLARQDKRLRLVNIPHLPEGWCGKNNAMQTAIASTGGQWICMIDADCRQTSRRTLSVAYEYARQQGADLLSVLPTLEMKGFWENVVQPVCGGIMIIWFNPDKVNDPKKPHAYSNGAFMLIRRATYQAVGTHEAIKGQVNEDMHMAERVKSAGHRLMVVQNSGLYMVRMYTSLQAITRGWSRIFFGTFCTMKRLSVSLAVISIMGMLPYLTAALGAAALAAGVTATAVRVCTAAAALAILMQVSAIYRFYSLISARKFLAWTYVLGCAVGAICLVKAMFKLRAGSKLNWRNTVYTKGAATAGAAQESRRETTKVG